MLQKSHLSNHLSLIKIIEILYNLLFNNNFLHNYLIADVSL